VSKPMRFMSLREPDGQGGPPPPRAMATRAPSPMSPPRARRRGGVGVRAHQLSDTFVLWRAAGADAVCVILLALVLLFVVLCVLGSGDGPTPLCCGPSPGCPPCVLVFVLRRVSVSGMAVGPGGGPALLCCGSPAGGRPCVLMFLLLRVSVLAVVGHIRCHCYCHRCLFIKILAGVSMRARALLVALCARFRVTDRAVAWRVTCHAAALAAALRSSVSYASANWRLRWRTRSERVLYLVALAVQSQCFAAETT
jgi:hypothetical protein